MPSNTVHDEYTHVSFSDESNWNVGRFRAIGMLSASAVVARSLHKELLSRFSESGVDEFKWQKLRDAKYRFAAEKVIKILLPLLAERCVRVDVLAWDTQDHRHQVRNPDPDKNLQIMYYHLFRNVMRLRWPKTAIWRLIPDEHTSVHWDTVETFLLQKSMSTGAELAILTPDIVYVPAFREFLKVNFQVHSITPARSGEMCLCQVADLFAGLACYSRQHGQSFSSWRSDSNYDELLFEEHRVSAQSSHRERFPLFEILMASIECTGLKVQFSVDRGLYTPDPSCCCNFWWYQPFSKHDKAPSRQQEL